MINLKPDKIIKFHLKKNILLKKKIKKYKNAAGRNNSGKITVSHKGGGHSRKYREINFKRTNLSIGIVLSVEYDPMRTANIIAIYDFLNKTFFYILAPKNIRVGDILKSGPRTELKLGNSLQLMHIPVGSYIHNISSNNNRPAKISRSAGSFCKLKRKEWNHVIIELSSGKSKRFSSNCYATIGAVSNELFFLFKLTKAGQSRWLNNRPVVRGVAMNPVDHPHGGGEGKKSGNNKSPWGIKIRKKRN